jgi:hypothetical protein
MVWQTVLNSRSMSSSVPQRCSRSSSAAKVPMRIKLAVSKALPSSAGLVPCTALKVVWASDGGHEPLGPHRCRTQVRNVTRIRRAVARHLDHRVSGSLAFPRALTPNCSSAASWTAPLLMPSSSQPSSSRPARMRRNVVATGRKTCENASSFKPDR